MKRVRAALRDPSALRDALSEVAPSDLAPLLERLLDYRDEFGVEDAQGVPVLLGLLPVAREWAASGVLAVSARILLDAILISLLRAVPDVDRASYIEALFADLPTLSEKHHLILVCHESEGGVEALLEAAIHAKLVSQLVKKVEATSIDELIRETELRRLCQTLQEAGGSRAGKKLLQIASDDRALIAVVVGSASLRRAQAMGSVVVHQQAEVFWDLLEQIFGTEELRGRLVQVLNRAAEGEIEVDAFVLGLIAARLTNLASAEATIVHAAPATSTGGSEEDTLSSAEGQK